MAVAYQGIVINLVLAVFNLIPVAPLDGAAVLSGLLPRPLANALDQLQSYGFIVLLDRKDLPSSGAGETPIVGIAPAVGNAICDAIGVRLRSLPMAPKGLKT